MNIVKIAALIGKNALLTVPVTKAVEWKVPVVIEDARQAYGMTTYLVSQAGSTPAWVAAYRLEVVA